MIYKFKEFKDEPLLINHLNMGGKNPKGEEINVTSRYFTRNGKPWIGVMGEFHFSRYGRENWHRELAKMKAGGITMFQRICFGYTTKKLRVKWILAVTMTSERLSKNVKMSAWTL